MDCGLPGLESRRLSYNLLSICSRPRKISVKSCLSSSLKFLFTNRLVEFTPSVMVPFTDLFPVLVKSVFKAPVPCHCGCILRLFLSINTTLHTCVLFAHEICVVGPNIFEHKVQVGKFLQIAAWQNPQLFQLLLEHCACEHALLKEAWGGLVHKGVNVIYLDNVGSVQAIYAVRSCHPLLRSQYLSGCISQKIACGKGGRVSLGIEGI